MQNRRRCSVSAAIAAIAAMLLVGPVAHATHGAGSPAKHKIAYQLSEAGVDKAKFVLGNIRNHIAGVGADRVEAIELIVFGPALKGFVLAELDPGVKLTLEQLQTQGLAFGVCANTMKNFSIALAQLPEGSRPLPQGGVVRLMEVQEQGYAVIRP